MKKNGIKKALAFTMALTLLTGASSLPANTVFTESTITVSAASTTTTMLFNGFNYIVKKDSTIEIQKYIGTKSTVIVPSEIYGKKVTSLGSNSFNSNKKIKNVTIPGTVTEIKTNAFAYSGVQTVKIEKGLKTIGDSAFNLCRSLKTINIPSGVTTIGKYAFYYNENLEKISIPDTVTKIGDAAFYNCSSLKEVKLSRKCTTIPSGAFELFGVSGTSTLKTITIPEGVTTISSYAFKGRYFKSVEIPKSVKTIGYKAFGYNWDNSVFNNYRIYGYNEIAEEYAYSTGLLYSNKTKGDVNGDGVVNVTDIAMVAAHIKGIKALTPEQQKRADVNNDGKIDVSDIGGTSAHIKGIKAIE